MARFSSMHIIAMVMVTLFTIKTASAYPKSHTLKFEVGPVIRNCRDVQRQGNNSSGLYTIFPDSCCPERPLQVYCDMDTEGGGWTVIQRRDDIEPREDFFRTWIEYALGFGNLKGEFWLGLDHIHALTDQALNEIRFDLEDFDNSTRWAQYKFFFVHDRSSSYKMEVNGYSGDAGDAFTYQNGQRFSAKDNDLDPDDSNCADRFKGAWWYKTCHHSNPNGMYLSGNHTTFAIGINWHQWRGYHYSLKRTEIKIKPAY